MDKLKNTFCLSILHAPVLTLKSEKGGGRMMDGKEES